MIDEYRVNLFKKKIRSSLPELQKLRFYHSKGRCHLHINIRYGWTNPDAVGAYVMQRLRAAGIEAKEMRDPYGIWKMHSALSKAPLDSIAIPIDQEALPERRKQ